MEVLLGFLLVLGVIFAVVGMFMIIDEDDNYVFSGLCCSIFGIVILVLTSIGIDDHADRQREREAQSTTIYIERVQEVKTDTVYIVEKPVKTDTVYVKIVK
jgi:hypothetical protein